jgi:protein TonB
MALTPQAATPPGPAGGAGSLAAFLAALSLHAGALALLVAWPTTASVAPPGEQTITIDLAPQMVEASGVEPVETSVPAGAPAILEPVEAAEADPPVPAEPAPPLEAASGPPPVDGPAPARTELSPALAEAPPAPEAPPIESTAAEAPDLPLALPPRAEPETVAALPVLDRPAPRRPPEVGKPRATPRETKPREARPRENVAKERARRAAQATSGAGGQDQRKAARGASAPESDGGAAAAADPSTLSRYVAQLAAALKGRLRYPEAARAAGAAGTATLRFTLHRSGRVVSATLVRGAGHPALDAAALATAAPGSSLPPAPDEVPQQHLTVSVPLRFNVQ